jgi:hypothetical protein
MAMQFAHAFFVALALLVECPDGKARRQRDERAAEHDREQDCSVWLCCQNGGGHGVSSFIVGYLMPQLSKSGGWQRSTSIKELFRPFAAMIRGKSWD